MESHDTIILGFSKSKDTRFIKTFAYPEQEPEMRECIAYVSKNYETWQAGDISCFDFEGALRSRLEGEDD